MSDLPSERIPDELAVRELQEFGRLLDAMESGRIPMNSRQYRKSSVLAVRILKNYFEVLDVVDACAVSPALADLRENVSIERALAGGTIRVNIPGLTEPRA